MRRRPVMTVRSLADPLLDCEQAAEYLGTPVRFTRRLIAERRIRFVRVGRYVRIPTSALREYVSAGTVDPVERSTVWGWSA
jgi:excisionase family DNA binding protein